MFRCNGDWRNINSKSAEECKNICYNDPNCVAVTWQKTKNHQSKENNWTNWIDSPTGNTRLHYNEHTNECNNINDIKGGGAPYLDNICSKKTGNINLSLKLFDNYIKENYEVISRVDKNNNKISGTCRGTGTIDYDITYFYTSMEKGNSMLCAQECFKNKNCSGFSFNTVYPDSCSLYGHNIDENLLSKNYRWWKVNGNDVEIKYVDERIGETCFKNEKTTLANTTRLSC